MKQFPIWCYLLRGNWARVHVSYLLPVGELQYQIQGCQHHTEVSSSNGNITLNWFSSPWPRCQVWLSCLLVRGYIGHCSNVKRHNFLLRAASWFRSLFVSRENSDYKYQGRQKWKFSAVMEKKKHNTIELTLKTVCPYHWNLCSPDKPQTKCTSISLQLISGSACQIHASNHHDFPLKLLPSAPPRCQVSFTFYG